MTNQGTLNFKKLIKSSIHNDLSFWEKQKIQLVNLGSIVLQVVSLILFVLFLMMKLNTPAIISVIGGAIFFIPFYVNKLRKYNYARLILCIEIVMYFTAMAVFLGKGAGLEYALIITSILPTLFFNSKKLIIPLFIFSFICFVACKISFYYLPISYPHFAWVYIYDSVLLGVFILLFLIVNKFKSLQNSNEVTIFNLFNESKTQHIELKRLHEELIAQTKAIEKGAIVVTTDLKGIITSINPLFTQTSKFEKPDILGKSFMDVQSGFQSMEFFEKMHNTIRNGKIWRGEICSKSKRGSLYWIDTTIVPVLNEKAKPYKFLAIGFIITKQKQAEQKLIEQNENITSSINYASRIQNAILPTENIISKGFNSHFILFKPRDIVSGDFYWFSNKDNKSIIAAVDCTGHGVPGAFMSMIGSIILDNVVNKLGITKPNLILEKLNLEIIKILKQTETNNHDGMDIALCVYDHENKKLEYSGANNPLVIIKQKELIHIKGDRLPIGGSQKSTHRKYTNHQFDLNYGDIFYIYSDGYQDQFGGKENKKFMSKNFRNLLSEIHNKPLDDQKLLLESIISDWQGNQRQTDDILVIGCKA